MPQEKRRAELTEAATARAGRTIAGVPVLAPAKPSCETSQIPFFCTTLRILIAGRILRGDASTPIRTATVASRFAACSSFPLLLLPAKSHCTFPLARVVFLKWLHDTTILCEAKRDFVAHLFQ